MNSSRRHSTAEAQKFGLMQMPSQRSREIVPGMPDAPLWSEQKQITRPTKFRAPQSSRFSSGEVQFPL